VVWDGGPDVIEYVDETPIQYVTCPPGFELDATGRCVPVALNGDLRLTVDHPGARTQVCTPDGRCVTLSGLGDATSDARDQLSSLAFDTLEQWKTTLSNAVSAIPIVGVSEVTILTARSRLNTAISEIDTQVQPAILAILQDPSVDLATARARVMDFLQNYGNDLKGQMAAANVAVRGTTLQGQLDALGNAMLLVIRKVATAIGIGVGAGAGAVATGLPGWAIPAGIGLLALTLFLRR
jgi:hypothetical protein